MTNYFVPKTTTQKSPHGGWRSESFLDITDDKRLCIITMKRFSGNLTTTANVSHASDNGMYFYAPFSDFNKTLIATTERATEKAVIRQHNEALKTLELIKYQALDFYQTKGVNHAQLV